MELMDKLKRDTIKNYVDNQLPDLIEKCATYPATHVKSFTTQVKPIPGVDKQYCMLSCSDEEFSPKFVADGRYGVTNIQIHGEPGCLAKLNLGGQPYELLDPQTGRCWMTCEGRSIPIIVYHEIAIEFQFGEWLDPVTVTWDLVKYHNAHPPVTLLQSVNSFQHMTHIMGDDSHTPYFAIPPPNGMPLAKLSVQFLDGDTSALSAVWLYTCPDDNIHRLTINSKNGSWELTTLIDTLLFLPDNAKIQYSRLDGKQPPTRACVRLDTWNLTRVMGGMYGAMF